MKITINKKEIELTPLKIIAISVTGLIVLFTLLANILQMSLYRGVGGAYVAGLVFAMFGEFVIAFALGFIIWLLSDFIDTKKPAKTKKEKDSKTLVADEIQE